MSLSAVYDNFHNVPADFRGGKASSRSNNKLKPKNRSRDDDNDDENVPLRKTRASRRKDSRKRSRRRGKSFSDALNALGKQGYAVAEDIFRRGKVGCYSCLSCSNTYH